MAERVGFEPTLEFPLNTLSKRAPSATRPSLLQSQSLRNLSENSSQSLEYSRGPGVPKIASPILKGAANIG
jgi:hypothetical protein